MNLSYIGNPENIFIDAKGNPVIEGLWYRSSKQSKSKCFRVISLSDNQLDYQYLDMQNTNVFKVLSGAVQISTLFASCDCTGFVPNGESIVAQDLLTSGKTLNEYNSSQLLTELLNRGFLQLIDKDLQIYKK